MSERFLTVRQVSERTSLSVPELYRRIRLGTFPKQVSLGPSRVAWLESTVDRWIIKMSEGKLSEMRR